MLRSNEREFGGKNLTIEFRNYCIAESALLKKTLSQTLNERAQEIKIILASTCNTASAIADLSEHEKYFYAEAVVLARSFIETIINFIYLQICDKAEFDNYLKYAMQKSYRKLDKKMEVGEISLGVKFTGAEDLLTNPQVKEALAEFTSKKGREKTRWTTKSLVRRLEIIAERTPLEISFFMLATTDIYDDASETLHGTLYGCSYKTWVFEPSVNHENQEEVERYTQKKVSLLFVQLGVLFHQVILTLYGLNQSNEKIYEIMKESETNTQQAAAMIKSGSLKDKTSHT